MNDKKPKPGRQTHHPERRPVWLAANELEYLLSVLGDDPLRMASTLQYALKQITDNSVRIAELVARAKVGTGYEETEEEKERLRTLKESNRAKSKAEKLLGAAEELPLEQLQVLLAKCKELSK